MKGLVIYQSKYGATSQYAEWIGAGLNLPVVNTADLQQDQLAEADFVIIGSSVYIGKLLIKKWLNTHLRALWKKKIFIFVVCGTPASEKQKLDAFINSSIPAEFKNGSDIYFLPGKMKVKALSFWDRFMLRMGAKLAKTREESRMMLRDYNDVKQENVLPLISAVNSFNQHYSPIPINERILSAQYTRSFGSPGVVAQGS